VWNASAEGCLRQEYSPAPDHDLQAGRPQMIELWAKWEGQVINGGFPLRRLIGVSDHSAVFVTEAPAHNLPNAAVKLVPAIPTLAESQLAYWNAAAALSHPRLLRLFAAGRCHLPGGTTSQGDQHFLYVLMEYADQNLAQLLETRALTEGEARETLPPLLDGLAFLHSRNLVQGQLKPSNILVVGEQLKLASDTIRPAGEAATSISMVSVYDPPEGRDGSFSTAGDIWALGVTLYEALTRTTPARPDERSHGVTLPPDFPPASADVIRECLSRRPTDRPNVTALQAWVGGKVRYTRAQRPSAAAVESSSPSGLGSAGSGVGAAGSDAGVAGGGAGRAVGAGDARGGAGARASRAGEVGGASEAGGASDVLEGPALAGERGLAAGKAARSAAGTATGPASGVASEAATGLVSAFASEPAAGSAARAVVGPASPSLAGARATPNQGRLTIRVEREPIHEEPPQRRSPVPVAAALSAVLAVLIIGWGAVRLIGHRSGPGSSQEQAAQKLPGHPPAAATPEPNPSVPSPSEHSAPHDSVSGSSATSQPVAPATSGPSTVVHEEIPNVPHSALATIHGHVKVAVRVTVDSSGNVVDDRLDHAGPSHYFARVASQAARKWKFAPDPKSGRQWVVHFDFSRTGTAAHATSARS